MKRELDQKFADQVYRGIYYFTFSKPIFDKIFHFQVKYVYALHYPGHRLRYCFFFTIIGS